jgi:hypothetical protein
MLNVLIHTIFSHVKAVMIMMMMMMMMMMMFVMVVVVMIKHFSLLNGILSFHFDCSPRLATSLFFCVVFTLSICPVSFTNIFFICG